MVANHNEPENAEALFIDFAEEILAEMEKTAAEDGIPISSRLRVDFREDGTGTSTEIEEKSSYWGLLKKRFKESLWSMEEAERCVKKHLEEGKIRRPKLSDHSGTPILAPTYEQERPFLIRELLTPIIETLQRYDNFHPSREQLLEVYQQFLEETTATTIRREVSIPLLHFTSEVHQASIGNRLQLRELSPPEKSSLWEDGFFTTQLVGFYEFMASGFKLGGSYYHEQDKPRSMMKEVNEEAGRILTALRLFKLGDVGASIIFDNNTSVFASEGAHSSSFYEYDVPAARSTYTLREQEIPELLALYDALLRGMNPLAVAFRRFNQAYTRRYAEDRIIDLTIALESSLLSRIHDELRYRIALRGAALLSKIKPAKETYSTLVAIYDTRSDIVHEGKMLSDLRSATKKVISRMVPAIQPYELPQRCEDITREILKAYIFRIAAGESLSDINESLDRSIVERLTPQPEVTARTTDEA